jgi:hypothetical protein
MWKENFSMRAEIYHVRHVARDSHARQDRPMKSRAKQVVGWIAAAAALSAFPAIVSADSPVPVFDGHVHYNEDATIAYSPSEIVARMESAGVPRALVSSTSDENTLALL